MCVTSIKEMILFRKKTGRRNRGQISIEFAFCMIVIITLIYGLAMVLRWAGVSFIERDRAYDSTLSYIKDTAIDDTAQFYRPDKRDFRFTLPDEVLNP